MTSNERLRPRINIANIAGTWAACCTDSDTGARFTVHGSTSAAGAVVAVASKLTTNIIRAKEQGLYNTDLRTSVVYPACAGRLDFEDTARQRAVARLDKWNVDLHPVEGLSALDPSELGLPEIDIFGKITLGRDEVHANREAAHRARAAKLSCVAYWTDGSCYKQSGPDTGFGGWAWVCEDGRSASGPVLGGSATAEGAAIAAAFADATAQGSVAFIFTDSAMHARPVGTVVERNGHYVTKTRRNSTAPMETADRLAREAAQGHAAQAREEQLAL